MPAPLSAVDAISPAFDRTRQQLFRPFRLGRWLRLSVVGLLTGEFGGGGGSGGGGNFKWPTGQGDEDFSLRLWLADPVWEQVQLYLPVILVGLVGLLALALVWAYVACVFRFILFDGVVHDRCEVRAGWRRWQDYGGRFFAWEIGFGLSLLAGMAVLIGGPVFFAWRAGLLKEPDKNFGLFLGAVSTLAFLFLVLIFFGVLVGMLSRDFLLPLMALENLGPLEGWRRLLPLLGADKGGYAGYVLMKIVLAVGSAILFGIVNVVAILILLIPLAIVGVGVALGVVAAGLTWNPVTIAVAVALGLAALMVLFWVIAFLYAPGLVFFQSYALHFFGGRFPALGAILAPPPPAVPPAVAPPEAQLTPA